MNKIQTHTVVQPDADTTTFVLSCNRLEVLDKTIQSFLSTRDYQTRMVILDDSAEPGVFDVLVERYGAFSDVICFPRNRSQWWALDFMVSFCDTEYIFYLEDDWEFIKPGYLTQSRAILQQHRDIGTIDISLRTHADQGFETHEAELIDDAFYYKKFWRISDHHLHWYGWTGSPNLKRRDDLILLGRVEKWHNEWNIDRRFLALGLKSIFLKDRYVEHLGDHCSRMAGQRPDDSKTPEDFFPVELQADRVFPKFDYYHWDTHLSSRQDITLVTAVLDLEIPGTNFSARNLSSVTKILESQHPVVVYCEPRYHNWVLERRQGRLTQLVNLERSDLEGLDFFARMQELIHMPGWYNQADWISTSVLTSFYYLAFSLIKQKLLADASVRLSSNYYYWLDPDLFTSYDINHSVDSWYFTRIPRQNFFMLKSPCEPDAHRHGYSLKLLEILSGKMPTHLVCGAVFGGTPQQIAEVTEKFYQTLKQSLDLGTVGTEEAIFTIMSERLPGIMHCEEISTGDIGEYLRKLQ